MIGGVRNALRLARLTVWTALAALPAWVAADSIPALPTPVAAKKTWPGTPSPLLLQELQEYAARADVGGDLGIAVYSNRQHRFEAEMNDSQWFTPASCMKLLVTAAAVDAFPVNAYPTTTLEVRGKVRGRTLRGTLRVIGGGDPNISDRFFPDALTPLLAWADSLKALGIDTVRGRLEVTDTFFVGPRRPEAWAPRHFNTWYGAEVSALSYDDNAYEVRVDPGAPGQPPRVSMIPDVGYVRVINHATTTRKGGNRVSLSQASLEPVVTLTGRLGANAAGRTWLLPARNPPQYFRAALLTALRQRGLEFMETPPGPQAAPPLKTFRFTTAPFIDLLDEINQRSQNLHAELLLRHLGKRVKGVGSSSAGIAAEKEFVARLGLDSSAFDAHDGCGLSDRDHVKPRELSLLLARMARHRYAADYIGSLAQPGLDGATGKRLRDYADAGLVRYKTGTINGVAGLCGYAFALDGDTISVVLFLNRYRGSGHDAASLLDSLFIRTALWYNKERPAAARAFRLLGEPGIPSDYTQRLRYFSQALYGAPYYLGPTGEGRFGAVDPQPIADLERFDCVTYMESVIGLARSKQARDLVPSIIPFRYHGDTVGYNDRNHYFVGEWLKNNARLFRVIPVPGDTVIRKTLYRRALMAGKGISSPDLDAEIRYVPYETALKLSAHWTLGDRFLGVAFLTAKPGLDATHTGFLDVRGGRPFLRNASQLQGKVVEQDFHDYLETRRGKCAGVLFFEFLTPRSGG